jgi:hypothetical protein
MDGGGDGVVPIIIHLIIIHLIIIHLILPGIRSGLRRPFILSARILNPLLRHRATGITAVIRKVIILMSRVVLKGGSRLLPSHPINHPANRSRFPKKMRRLSILLALCSFGACTSVPSGPGVMVLPGSGKSFDEFRGDNLGCRRYAGEQAGLGSFTEPSEIRQQRYDTAYAQCMYLKGHRVPFAGQIMDSATSGGGQTPGMPPPGFP